MSAIRGGSTTLSCSSKVLPMRERGVGPLRKAVRPGVKGESESRVAGTPDDAATADNIFGKKWRRQRQP